MLTSTALSLNWIQVILIWNECVMHLQQLNYWNLTVMIGKQLKFVAAPTLWFILGVLASNGRSILHRIYPNTIVEEMQPIDPHNIRRQHVKHYRRALRKHQRHRTRYNNRSDPWQHDRPPNLGHSHKQVLKQGKQYT